MKDKKSMCKANNCYCRRRQLVSIEEPWNLPISADIPTRQQQNLHSQRNGASAGFQKNFSNSTTSSPAYHSTNGGTHKSFKRDHGKKSITSTCSFNLPQQHQVYNYFQHCTNELGLMQHLQNQLRLQQNQQMSNTIQPPTASEAQSISNPSGNSSNNLNVQENSNSQNSAQNLSLIRNCDKLLQPKQLDRTKILSLKDSDKSLEDDLKNIISQRNLATTITENFLRTFGSDDIDVKDINSADSFGKSLCKYGT